MAFSLEQLTAIEEAIASGALSVAFDGRQVTYRSVNELLKARSTVRAALRESGLLPKNKRTSYVSRRMD